MKYSAAMEAFLLINGFEIDANVDEQEKVILQVASSATTRDEFTSWVLTKMKPT